MDKIDLKKMKNKAGNSFEKKKATIQTNSQLNYLFQ